MHNRGVPQGMYGCTLILQHKVQGEGGEEEERHRMEEEGEDNSVKKREKKEQKS